MKAQFSRLLRVDHNEKIGRDTQYEIWYGLEQGLLLALRDRGTISMTQYQLAMERLKQQRTGRNDGEGCSLLPGVHG